MISEEARALSEISVSLKAQARQQEIANLLWMWQMTKDPKALSKVQVLLMLKTPGL